jgi:hypothetical protein
MKKVIMLCLILALTVPMLCASANAEEYADPKDARNVPPEIQQLADEANADVVFHRLYTPTLVMVCSQSDNMDEVLENMSTSDYFAATRTELWCYEMVDGEPQLTKSFPYSNSLVMQMITQEAIMGIAPDICIESVYYLSTGFAGNGEPSAIYYKTNLGEYVYYHIGNGIILNADRFLEYMHQWRTYIEKTLDEKGGFIGGYPMMHTDLSAYDWRSPDFDPDAPLPIEKDEPEPDFPWLIVGIGAAVLIAGAVVTAVIVIRRKKRKATSEETEQITEET